VDRSQTRETLALLVFRGEDAGVGKRSEGSIETESGRGQAVNKSEFLPRLTRLTPLFGALGD